MSAVSATPQVPVIVYVWVSLVKSGSPGHAAMEIGGGTTPATGYVSFAPLVEGSISGAGKFFDKEHDRSHYAGRGLWIGCIYGLDTEKMLQKLKADLASPPAYGPLNECATTVRTYLVEGGGNELASWWSSWSLGGVVSPDDLEDYAQSIVERTRDRGSYDHSVRGEGSLGWALGIGRN